MRGAAQGLGGTPGQSLALGGWLNARQAWLLVETGHQLGTCCLVSEPLLRLGLHNSQR